MAWSTSCASRTWPGSRSRAPGGSGGAAAVCDLSTPCPWRGAPRSRYPRQGPAPATRPPATAAMRALQLFIVALALLAPVAPALAGDASRELIVQLSAGAVSAPGMSARHVGALPTAVRGRFAALGLHATRALTEQLSDGARPLPEL